LSSSPTRVKRERRSVTFVLLLLFCLFTGVFFFLRSPYFHIREFRVEGLGRVSREEILARCGQDSPSIFAFDTEKAEDLIELCPWIQMAEVWRELPGTVAVRVTERTPVAFMPVGDDLWLIDAEARVLGKDDGTWTGLVALTGPEVSATPGQFLDAGTYGWGLKALATMGPVAREKLTEISIQAGEASLILDDGCRVLLGKDTGDIARKAAALDSVLRDLHDEGKIAERIDLRFEKVAIKLRLIEPLDHVTGGTLTKDDDSEAR
jgi:cell division septal protein FtsQ